MSPQTQLREVEAVLAALQHAAEKLLHEGASDGLVVLTAPFRGTDPWSMGYGRRRGGWDARAHVEGEPVVVHWGSAAVVEAHGPSRFEDARDAGQRLLSRVRRMGDAPFAPLPRLWGGLSFSVEDQGAHCAHDRDPWRGFGEARFVLPRWVVGVSVLGGYVQLATSVKEILELDGLRREVLEVLDAPPRKREGTGTERVTTSAGPMVAPPASAEGHAFVALVEQALREIDEHVIDKVVVARAERHPLARPVDIETCMRRLATTQPGCVHFAFSGGIQTLVGATPEKLVVRRGDRVETEALAGTAPRARDAERDLLASDKDQREHALVVEGIVQALRRSGVRVQHAARPVCRTLAQVVHLVTPIVATGSERHVLDWVADLHPTPAMGGWPRREAAAFIREHEPVSRGWYASPVGWFDVRGDGTFVVAIRSAVVDDDAAWLFAGAGVVEGSDPHRELEETGHKLAAMRGALEVSP